MWYFIRDTTNAAIGTKLFLNVAEHTVGRKDTSLVIPDDTSISRKHASISITFPEASVNNPQVLPVVKIKDLSKFGTFVNGQQIPKNESVQLRNGDAIKFGIANSCYKIRYKPLVVTTSCLEPPIKKETKKLLAVLGSHVVGEWSKDCDMIIMSKLSVTIKVICALIAQKKIVSHEYIKEFHKAVTEKKDLPDPNDYEPVWAESQLDPDMVSFKPNEGRRNLFAGTKFVFLSKKQFQKLGVAVELGGGIPILMDESTKCDMDLLIEDNTCVMFIDSGQSSQMSQSNSPWLDKIIKHLKRHNRRLIPEAELGFAVLHSSTEKYCNPVDTISLSTTMDIPSQSLSEMPDPLLSQGDVIVPNTCDSTFNKKSETMSTTLTTVVPETAPNITVNETSQLAKENTSSILNVKPPIEKTTRKRYNQGRQQDDEIMPPPKQIKQEILSLSEEQNKNNSISRDISEPIESIQNIKPEKPEVVAHVRKEPVQSVSNDRKEPVLGVSNDADDILGAISSRSRRRGRRGNTQQSESQNSEQIQVKTEIIDSEMPDVEIKNLRSLEIDRTKSARTKNTNDKDTKNNDSDDEEIIIKKEIKEEDDIVINTDRIETDKNENNKKKAVSMATKRKQEPQTGTVRTGFLSAVDIESQVMANPNYETDDAPSNLVQVVEKSLIVKRPRIEKTSSDQITTWNGRQVKNFKKFRKTPGRGAGAIPTIIGKPQLIAHHTMAKQKMMQEFADNLQRDSQQNEEDQEIDDFFNNIGKGSKSKRGRGRARAV